MNTSSVAIAILIIGFLVLIILRFPVAYAVALASMACLVYQGKSLNALCQQMVKGISSFSLMAVPFFITMGILMGSGGISERNFRFGFRGHCFPRIHPDPDDGRSGL